VSLGDFTLQKMIINVTNLMYVLKKCNFGTFASSQARQFDSNVAKSIFIY